MADDLHIISARTTILQALQRLNLLSGGVMTLAVVDDGGKMTGTVTDGDIRRGLLRGASLEQPVEAVMHRQFSSVASSDDVESIRRARLKGIKLLPVLRPDGSIDRLIDLTHTPTVLPLSAILMAGGRGERLRPMTLTTPKPLLPIGGRPIIDYNIANIARAGITDVAVTVNYLAEQLEDYFATPRHGVKVRCVREDKPLGTIGAASLISRNPHGDTLIMNSDLLTNVSLEEMYLRHRGEQAEVTIAAIPYTVSVPYAILETDGACGVSGLKEKPNYSYFANAGIYIFSNRLLDALPKDRRVDAPDLIEQAIGEGRRVVYYPIRGTWIDIGSPADFRHAEELMAHAARW